MKYWIKVLLEYELEAEGQDNLAAQAEALNYLDNLGFNDACGELRRPDVEVVFREIKDFNMGPKE